MKVERTKKKVKTELQVASRNYQQQLSADLNDAAIRVVEYGKSALIFGGAVYVGYTILDRFLEAALQSRVKKKSTGNYETLNKILLPIIAIALQQGSVVLLKAVRTRILKYLEDKHNDDVQEGE